MVDQGIVVDMHNHFIPEEFARDAAAHPEWQARVVEENGTPWVEHDQGFRYPLYETFLGGAAKLEDMDERYIDVSVMSLSPTLFYYWIGRKDAVAFARMANESLAKTAAASGGRIAGVAALPMQDPAAAAEELRHSVQELGMKGAHIGSSVEDRLLDDDSFTPFWEAANELSVPIMLHPYYVGPKPGLEDYYLTNTLGNPWDTALAASRLIYSGLFDRFPNLKVVLVHGGGFLPYQMGRLDHAWNVRPEPKARIQRAPSEYLEFFHFDTITHNDQALTWLAAFVGPEKVMLGTDLPYDMGDFDPVSRVSRAIADGARDKISGSNAISLFDLSL